MASSQHDHTDSTPPAYPTTTEQFPEDVPPLGLPPYSHRLMPGERTAIAVPTRPLAPTVAKIVHATIPDIKLEDLKELTQNLAGLLRMHEEQRQQRRAQKDRWIQSRLRELHLQVRGFEIALENVTARPDTPDPTTSDADIPRPLLERLDPRSAIQDSIAPHPIIEPFGLYQPTTTTPPPQDSSL